MKPFDLEAAKRGEPVLLWDYADRFIAVTFLSETAEGDYIVQDTRPFGRGLMRATPSQIKMAELPVMPKEKFIYIVKDQNNILHLAMDIPINCYVTAIGILRYEDLPK